MKFQRILALAGVGILVGMIFVTFVLAVTGSPLFMASMILTFTLPCLIYAWLFIYRMVKGDENLRDFGNSGDDGKEEKVGKEKRTEK